MIVFALSVLFGLLGSSMKPVPLIAALAPALAFIVLGSAWFAETTWSEALLSFYVGLACAELAYLAALAARSRTDAPIGEWTSRESQGS